MRFKFKPFVWADLNYGSELHVYCEYHVCVKELCQPSDSAESVHRVPELVSLVNLLMYSKFGKIKQISNYIVL